jgi:hypothetical protein
MMTKPKRKRNRRKRKQEEKQNYTKYYVLIAVGLLIGYWAIVQYSDGAFSNYPDYVQGVIYPSTTISPADSTVSIPKDFVEDNKLIFIDLKLETPVDKINYLGRTIPLNLYKNGAYIPIVIMSTPKGKTVSGIRVCEPCASFSFHIVERKYLECDACYTRWDIETLKGVSGGCEDYPPPYLSTMIGQQIEVSVAATGLSIIS